MPICTMWRADRAAGLWAAAATLASCGVVAVTAQEPVTAQGESTPLRARPASRPGTNSPPIGGPAAAAGSEAMARMRSAIAARKPAGDRQPALPATPSPQQRRRAFDALAHRTARPDVDERARGALAAGQVAAAREREAMGARLGQALGLAPPDLKALAGGSLPSAPAGFVPLLFISSSMPVAILRSYAAQLERSGGAMALRGMPGGLHRVAPMAKLAAEILRIDPGCDGPACAMRGVQIVVDPIAFRQFGIGRVPALAMVPGDPAVPYCERDETSPQPAERRLAIYGDAALSGLFEEYARQGGAKEVRDAQARLVRR
jgi:type-F conjugative transfer system pilin assembly protein TrbC